MSLNIDASSSYASLIQRLQSSTKTSTSGSVQGSMPPPPPQGGENKMMSDLADVFAELGISTESLTTSSTDTSSDTTSTTASSSDAQTALAEFMQTLMDTLHAQGPGKSAAGNEGSDGYGQDNPMKADMQTLLSKLGLSSESSSTDSTSSTDSSVSELQSKFSDLLESLGASDSGISLGDFLTSFSGKIPEGRGQGRIGNVVNTTA